MKKTLTIFVFVMASMFAFNAQAQWSTGADLVSGYVWRGTKFGTGPAIQPTVEYGVGGFSIGAWGSYGLDANAEESSEADLYVGYEFGLSESSSLSLALTDYYFPSGGIDYFEGEGHSFEPMVGLSLGDFSFTAAYMINKSGAMDISDTYLEAGLTVGAVDLALGAGDGQYTSDGDFNFCNISVGTSKEVKITDSFSLPVFGSVILNPSTEQFHIVVGISL